MAEEPILSDKKDGAAVITLNRPDKRNAITFEMMEKLD